MSILQETPQISKNLQGMPHATISSGNAKNLWHLWRVNDGLPPGHFLSFLLLLSFSFSAFFSPSLLLCHLLSFSPSLLLCHFLSFSPSLLLCHLLSFSPSFLLLLSFSFSAFFSPSLLLSFSAIFGVSFFSPSLPFSFFSPSLPSYLIDDVLVKHRSSGNPVTGELFTYLIKIYAEAKLPEKALSTFYKMLEFNFTPQPKHLNRILEVLVSHRGYLQKAFELSKSARLHGVLPNTRTYNILMQAFCLNDELSIAYQLFGKMLERDVVPDVESYWGTNIAVDKYCCPQTLGDKYCCPQILVQKLHT